MRHTPGPWLIRDTDEGSCIIETAEFANDIVGGCGCCGSPWIKKEDANLIAAAPMLLGALAVLIDYADCGEDNLPTRQNAVNLARAAMAKAEGAKE